MKPLTILIPTITGREQLLDRLLQSLEPQCSGVADIDIYLDEGKEKGGKTTGEKRNDLVNRCKTPYCCFIDDDDAIASDYISEILTGILTEVDCVTFSGHLIQHGYSGHITFDFRIGNPYDDLKDMKNRTLRRPPNHLCAIKTEIMQKIPFPDITFGEDYTQCLAMAQSGVLKTEHHVDKVLYYYYYHKRKPY